MIATYVATAVTAVQALVITPVLVHGLGTERYGIWALVASFALFAGLLDLGLASATVRYVALAEGRGDFDLLVRTVSASFWILSGFAVLAVIVGVVFAPFFPRVFGVTREQSAALSLVVLVAVSVGFRLVAGAFMGSLSGLQRYSANGLISSAVTVVQTVAYAVIVWSGGKLVALGVALLALTAVDALARYVVLRRHVPDLTLSFRVFKLPFAKRLLAVSAWISSTQVATIVRYRLDTVVVGLIVGVRAAGVYAVGQMLFIAADRFIRPILTGFFPYSAELGGRRDTTTLRSAMLTGTRISLAVAGPACLSLILLAGPALAVWVGESFHEARLVVVYLAAALLLATLTRAGLLMLQGSGNVRIPAAIVWLEAVVNLALSIVLGVTLGLTGVALGTLLATACVSTAVGVPYICKAFAVPTFSFVSSIVRAHAPPAAAAVLVAWLIHPSEQASVVAVVAAGAAICTVYLATLALTGMQSDERRRIWASMRRVSVQPDESA